MLAFVFVFDTVFLGECIVDLCFGRNVGSDLGFLSRRPCICPCGLLLGQLSQPVSPKLTPIQPNHGQTNESAATKHTHTHLTTQINKVAGQGGRPATRARSATTLLSEAFDYKATRSLLMRSLLLGAFYLKPLIRSVLLEAFHGRLQIESLLLEACYQKPPSRCLLSSRYLLLAAF